MKKLPLRVSLHAREPSIVELTVGDRVQLDRLIASPHGCVAERHGRLLAPGVTRLALAPGHYFFKTLSAANLRVVTGGVAASVPRDIKTNPPDPSSAGNGSPPAPKEAGDQPPGEPPRFTVE